MYRVQRQISLFTILSHFSLTSFPYSLRLTEERKKGERDGGKIRSELKVRKKGGRERRERREWEKAERE